MMASNDPLYFAVNTQDLQIAFSTLKPTKHTRAVFTRSHRPASPLAGLGIDSRLAYIRNELDLDLDFYRNLSLDPWTVHRRSVSVQRQMKKRRSVQSILIPSFLQGSSNSTPTSPGSPPPSNSKRISRDRAHSSAAALGRWSVLNHQQPVSSPVTPTAAVSSHRDSPPPDFLLDDDPFANLNPSPVVTRFGVVHEPPTDTALPTPRSLLMPTVEEIPSTGSVRPHPTFEKEMKKSSVSRPFTSSRILPVAAHQRPAFSPRPSLPSLSSLAQMNVVLTKKPRKGRVGAGLPFEPWDNPNCELPPRVLQDVNGTSTQSLPPGTQPLLPSQLIGFATGTLADNATTDDTVSPSHLDVGPSSWTPSASNADEVNSTAQHISLQELDDETYRPSRAHVGQSRSASSSESGHGNELLDDYFYERSSSDLEHGEDGTSDDADHDGLQFSNFSVYGHPQHNTDFSTTITSRDEFSPPPSPRLSSLDLLEHPPTLSRSVSSHSVSSSTSSSRESDGHHEEEDECLTSRLLQDAIVLEERLNRTPNTSVTHTSTTRSSLDDSDSLCSPVDSDYHSFFESPSSYIPNSKSPTFIPALPLSPSSPHRIPSSTMPSASFSPVFSSIYDQESTASDLVATWRHRQLGADLGTGTFLSDLDLSDPFRPHPSTSVLLEEDAANFGRRNPDPELSTSSRPGSPRSSRDGSLAGCASPSSRVHIHPPSLPTHIPSVKSEESLDSSSGGFLGAGTVGELSWPSSADTVRPAIAHALSQAVSRPSEAGCEGMSQIATGHHDWNGNGNGSSPCGGGAVMEVDAGGHREANLGGYNLDHNHDDYPGHQLLPLSGERHQVENENSFTEDFGMLRKLHAPMGSASGAYGSGFAIGAGRTDGGSDSPGGTSSRARSHSNQEYVGGSGAPAGHSGWGVTGGRYNGASWGRNGGRGGFGTGRGDEDDQDDRRRRRLHHGPESSPSVSINKKRSTSSASDTGEDSTDDYGPPVSAQPAYHAPRLSSPGMSQTPRFPVSSTATSSSDDDDVPLAQRIPTALTAQKSIRQKVREERNQKKLERAVTTVGPSSSRPSQDYDAFSRDRHATLRPATAGGTGSHSSSPFSSSQEAALRAYGPSSPQAHQQEQQPKTRHRTLTMPSKTPAQNPFSAEDLATRLQNVQLAAEQHQVHQNRSPSTSAAQPSVRGRGGSFDTPEKSPAALARGRSMKDYGNVVNSSPSSLAKHGLRLMRSFQREKRSVGGDEHPALPSDAEQKIAKSLHHQLSRSQSRVRGEESPVKRSLSISRAPPSPHGYDDALVVPPVPPMPSLPARMSVDEGSGQQQPQQHYPRKLWKAPGSSGGGGFGSGRRPSMDVERGTRSPGTPLTSLPAVAGQVVQQRVFVGDMQRFNMVELTVETTAGDVVDMIEAQGSLNGIVGVGGWMVWEVVQDFGMERPIRSFELLSDVQASWNKDKMVNLFVLRMTPLAVPLNRSAIPSSSPVHSGYVEWEAKRGKWSKRWMQLREHSLWLSKRQGKDEVLLCSLSNFDAYHITRVNRAPKPFAFSIKSTDSLTFFENTDDYLHNFACNEREGKIWMEKIMVARSYVLHQERQVLFSNKAPGANPPVALSRSGTRKTTPHQRVPVAPLVSIPPPYTSQIPQRDLVFEPGSLLHKQT